MSINSWKKEFYQGRIRDAAKDPLTAVDHSLRKWEGLKSANVAKHGLVAWDGALKNPSSNATFYIDNDSCALCQMSADDCRKCPIVLATDKTCDGTDSPFADWLCGSNPTRMIKVLKSARRYVLEHMK